MKRNIAYFCVAVLVSALAALWGCADRPTDAADQLGKVGGVATTTGTWELYPAQTTSYSVEVRPPLKSDGSTIVRSNEVPVKFRLLTQPGPIVFESILSDVDLANDYSYLSFTLGSVITFNQLTTLKADYAFVMGNCGGGSIRWSVRVDVGNDGDPGNDKSVFIYYGVYPNFTDCEGANNQSGVNMINSPNLRYDLTQLSGPFYGSYVNAQALVGGLRVVRASLVVDGGWSGGDDRLNISNVTVNDNTFQPIGGSPTQTCDIPPATIKVTKFVDPNWVTVPNPISIQPPVNDVNYRIVDCMYIYNLATSSLMGSGTYKVEAIVNGVPAGGYAQFIIP